MYKNAGKSIKGCVTTIVAFMMLVWIAIGSAIGVLLYKSIGGVGIVLSASVAMIGCFSAWLGGLLLYAYGDIADNIKTIKRIVENSQDGTKSKKSVDYRKEGRKWKCASCGNENLTENAYCVECNVSRVWSEEYWNKHM